MAGAGGGVDIRTFAPVYFMTVKILHTDGENIAEHKVSQYE